LADLSEPVGPEARSPEAVLAFEIASALLRYRQELGGFSVDLVARRDSWHGIPLLSIDPREVPSSDPHATQEAIYSEFVLSGMLRDYDVIHCLAPLIAPVQILLHSGKAVLQNWTVSQAHPAAQILSRLGARGQWRGCAFRRGYNGSVPVIPASIDLDRFVLPQVSETDYVLYLGGRSETRTARAICSELQLPLRTELASSVADLQNARLLLDLEKPPRSIPPIWALRALACGVPVAGWRGCALDEFIDAPDFGALAPPGDWHGLVRGIREIDTSAAASQIRREKALLKSSRRAMAARFLAEYRVLLGIS
jgi:hypothetical protein